MNDRNHGTTGQLIAPDGTKVEVGITERSQDLLLVVLGDAGTLFDNPLEGLTLESSSNHGVVRTEGYGELVDQGLIRFIVDDNPDLVQRRQFVRVIAPQRVVLEDEETEELIADTLAVNVSGGGALLKLKELIEVDRRVRFDLFIDEDRAPVTGIGRVIRATSANQQAIVFESISRADRERLIHFIFERQRHALAVTRGDHL